MGNRLSKIYTKTGDDGSTGMADGSRVSKADLLFEVMGDVDELNSNLGLVKSYYQLGLSTVDNNAAENSELAAHMAQLNQPDFGEVLQIIQHLLFNLGGELAMPEYPGISETHTAWLEQQIDAMNTHLPPLKDFILPTGSVLVSQLHIARCVCRRAERHGVALRQSNPEAIRATALAFINRLSDWLFVASRFCCAPAQRQEVLWDAKILQDF
ncbi:cob(I)yrinic acid a,c-diamide adenosyltransferase [Psychrobacter arenosus]|uniref:cob(I)yrinic acid a,c-diamide adenosyltransferase n=1 Tax=Psychrobacter arenosus TaxID=256326 RepID=UPI001917DC11|nr:cob(I)yrinic acid a,c-diamide adenosyltransferase [Psychrobacter arenosus]